MDPLYEQAPHTRMLCEYLEALEAGEIDRLAIFVPPRHGKTYHAGERFPAWCFGRHPEWQQITASYTIDRARASSRVARGLLREPQWPFPAVALADDSQGIDAWHTSAGGLLKAAGVGGGITGFGAHLFIIDDPIKGAKDAASLVVRDATWNWYTDVARTRLMRGGKQLLMMTRWHEDDLAGRILNSGAANRWTVLRLPAIAEANDPLGRAIGEPLWPGGMADVPSVADGEISSRSFESLYQGNPQPLEGTLFKRAWFEHRYDAIPEGATKVIQAVDSALGQSDSADYTVIWTLAYDGRDVYVVDVCRDRAEFIGLQRMVTAEAVKYRPQKIYVEEVAAHSGAALIQELKRTTGLPIVGVRPQGSKIARAELVTGYFEAGRVKFPQRAHWFDAWIDEALAFPNGTHDDQVDSIVMGVTKIVSASTLSWGKLSTTRS